MCMFMISTVIFVLMFAVICITGVILYNRRKVRHQIMETTGVVIRYWEHPAYTYHIRVSYEVDGRVYEHQEYVKARYDHVLKNIMLMRRYKYPVIEKEKGDTVTIVYNPFWPANCRIKENVGRGDT